jgi:hypothetical protein
MRVLDRLEQACREPPQQGAAQCAVGAKHWVGRDSCVRGLIWGLSERFTGPRLPSSADEHHRARPFAPQDELQTGSELG